MKKFTLLLSIIFCSVIVSAQTLLYDNGPLINSPGVGAGGADVSNMHDGIVLFGFGHAVSSGFKVAEDFIVPSPGWAIDSMVFFAYQTGSSLTSTMNEVKIGIWDGSPALGSNIIYGDTAVNAMISSYWSGIYRTTETTLSDATRPIMRDVVETPGLALNAGTYFVSWQTGGTLTSGPWAPEITINGITSTGDGLQFNPTTQLWDLAKDTSTTNMNGTGEIQGFPFHVYGHVTTGIEVHNGNVSSFAISNLHPVPVQDGATFTLYSAEKSAVVLSVRDYLGREIIAEQKDIVAGPNILTMNLASLNAGVYFMTASNDRQIVVSKFVKE
jgi:hypothetical protein